MGKPEKIKIEIETPEGGKRTEEVTPEHALSLIRLQNKRYVKHDPKKHWTLEKGYRLDEEKGAITRTNSGSTKKQ